MQAQFENSRPPRGIALKPQDVVVGARLALGDAWTYERLSRELGMSSQTVHAAVKRLESARLFNPVRKRISRDAFLEFVIHGVRFAFPAGPSGDPVRGIPTAVSAPPLAARFPPESEPGWVWPSRDGDMVGRAIPPLHPSAPRAARMNPTFHEILSLIDALRVGGARDRELASEELRRRIPQ